MKKEQYLQYLKQQYIANQLGFGSDWAEHITEMDLLWRDFSDIEQEELEQKWQQLKIEWDNYIPVAPKTLNLVDRIAESGITPRIK